MGSPRVRCAGCGALNAKGPRACGACGATLALPPAPPVVLPPPAEARAAPEADDVLASLPPRFAALLQLAVAAWLFRTGYGLVRLVEDAFLGPLAVLMLGLLFGVPALLLGVTAVGTLMMRAWGAYASASFCVLAGLAGLAIASQGEVAIGVRLLAPSVVVGVLLMLPTSRAAYR